MRWGANVTSVESLERLTFIGSVQSKMPSGRSPTGYTDLITKITVNNLTHSIREAENKDLWRIKTNNIP